MPNYNNGNETKKKIYDTAKSLFYAYGYSGASFNMICDVANVNPGTIAYHFKSKKNLGELIFMDIMNTMSNSIAEFFPSSDSVLRSYIGYMLHMQLIFKDEKYRKFSLDIVNTCDNIYTIDCQEVLNSLKELSAEKAKFIYAVHAGLDRSIENYVSKNINELSFERTCKYALEIYFSYFETRKQEHYYNEAYKCIQMLNCSNTGLDISISLK